MEENAAVHTVKGDAFESFVKDNALVFVDFWAPWCAPCKPFATTYARVATCHPEIVFCKMNIEEEPELAEMFNIRSIPHLMVFKQGIAIYSEAGSMPESTLSELVQQALEADVTSIRDRLDNDEDPSV